MFAIVSFIIMPPLWGCIGYLIVWCLFIILSFIAKSRRDDIFIVYGGYVFL